jgi:hypothetical protein
VLAVQRPGEEPQDYFTITLSVLMVNSYQIEAPAGRPVPARSARSARPGRSGVLQLQPD